MAEPGEASSSPPRLAPADILDLRAYERVRETLRPQVIKRKRVRRLGLGPIMTIVFESVDTVRFQVQEMARAERIVTDEGIQTELDIYNALLPRPGELSATLFIELTSDDGLREWLPRLIGIERSLVFTLGRAAPGARGSPSEVRSEPEAAHAEALTREEITPAVHYLKFRFGKDEIAAFADGPVSLSVRHPAYEAQVEVEGETHRQLLADLQGTTEPLDWMNLT